MKWRHIVWQKYSVVSVEPVASVLSTTVKQAADFSEIQNDTKKWELLKTPTKIEEIQKKNILTEIEPLQLAF